MQFDQLQHVKDIFLEFLFNLYILIVDFCFAVYYSVKPRIFINTRPKHPALLQSATQTHKDIIEGKHSCADVMEAFIERLEEVNPIVNGICAKDYGSARLKAKAMDDMLKNLSREKRNELSIHRPFFGIPITVKNNIDVKRHVNVCGWWKMRENRATEDAPCVQRMREAGAIIVALTNVPELCLWIETSNTTFGYTNNAYDTRRTCGGSSGGEAALISAGASVVGIGTDIAGSIRVPCMFSGLFGLKPSAEISPIEGLYPVDRASRAYLQTVGPMCRYAEDLAPMFQAMCLPSKFGQLRPAKEFKELKAFCFSGYKGWCTERLSGDQRFAFDMVVKYFEEALDQPVTHLAMPHEEKLYEMCATSVQDGLEKPYCDIMEGTRTYAEFIVDWAQTLLGNRKSKHSRLSLQANVNSLLMHGVTKEQVEQATHLRDEISDQLCSILGDDGILIVPGWPTTAVYHNRTVWKHSGITHTAVWNAFGMPVIAVPLGLSGDGLPLSVQIVGSKLSDLTLLRMAEHLDGHLPKCEKPQLFPGFVGPWTLGQSKN
ncbi:unnamed protein product, partial [Mesorhabditis spiculigera]